MDFLDVLYGGAAFSGGGGRGQQPSDNNNDARSGERYVHGTVESYATEQMEVQREAEERALSRAAADLQLGDQYANARSLPQGGALPPPAAAAIAPSDVARQISAAGHPVGARGGSGRVVWGSFERNTGTWCPYPDPEKIEAAYARGDASIFLPECFNAHVHFDRAGQVTHHHQRTAAVGAKPAGFRSVLRGTPGDKALLYFHMDVGLGMWRLDPPDRRGQTQQVDIVAPSADATSLWQWCDVMGDAIATAKENNWHTYDAEISADLEAAWAARRPTVQVIVGITTYIIGEFSGSYAVQRNTASGARRMVSRYASP